MRSFAVFAVLAFLGCAADTRPGHVWTFAYEGSDEGFAAASAAAAQWNACEGVALHVERGGPGVPLREVDLIEEAPDRAGVTRLDRELRPQWVHFVRYAHADATLAHEFGHVLGLGHAPHGLMSAENEGFVPNVTKLECSQLR